MRILVTGANGFVGKALCEHLASSNHEVIACTRKNGQKSTGYSHFYIVAIDKNTEWKSLLLGVQVVIHLAARVHVMHEKAANSLSAFQEVNLHGTVNLARQAATAGVKRFAYVSSIKVNGEYSDEKPFTESDISNPQDPYAISKWQAEQALQEIGRETGMEVVIVRPPLVYGPEVKANFLHLLDIVNRALPLPLGSINNRRSMIYVGNLVDALMLCATHPKAAGQTYLVSDGDAISSPQLIKDIALAMRKPSRVFPFPLSIIQFCARLLGKSSVIERLTESLEIDSSKIRKELGWAPPYTMQQGLQATTDWFASSKNKQKAD